LNKNPIVMMVVCALAICVGCAGVGRSGGAVKDYSQYERHFVDDYVEVMGRGFFDPMEFRAAQRERHELILQMTGDDRKFMNVRRMEIMMGKDVDKKRSSYYNIRLYLDQQVKAWVEPGAFILQVAYGDSIVEYRDLGLCTLIRLDAINDRDIAYLDSADRPYFFYDKMQPRSDNRPAVTWGRYPPEASQGKVVGMRIDYDHWRYEGPGVKPKPQWK